MSELLFLLLALALVALCGVFVAAEFAFITVNRQTAERHAARGDRRAKGVVSALHSLSTQLSGAQVGITITNLGIGFLAEPAVASLLRQPLANLGVVEAAVPGIAITLAVIIATLVTMIFGELVPKNFAIARPLATAPTTDRRAGQLARFHGFSGTADLARHLPDNARVIDVGAGASKLGRIAHARGAGSGYRREKWMSPQ